MEEKKPLDSRLTHTSKEPEAQLWAQIGTSSYSPLPSNDKSATTKPSKEDQQSPSKVNGTPTETPEIKNDLGEDSGNKDDESKPAEKGNSSSDEVPKSKSSTGSSDANTSRDSGSKRSRSRSRSRERRRRLLPDYTTNSNNPDDVKSRVFVGHLNTEKCTKEEIADLFEPYGSIVGVNLRDGYGFVQYKDESSVREAIKNVHAKVFHDMKLVVDKPVALRKLEASKRAKERDSREMMDELAYLRRREQERMRYDDYYDRARMPHPQPFYGDFMDRDDRYSRYGDGPRYGDVPRYGDGPRYDDHYYDRGYRADRYGHYRDDPYDYSYNQRGSYASDPYGRPSSRRM